MPKCQARRAPFDTILNIGKFLRVRANLDNLRTTFKDAVQGLVFSEDQKALARRYASPSAETADIADPDDLQHMFMDYLIKLSGNAKNIPEHEHEAIIMDVIVYTRWMIDNAEMMKSGFCAQANNQARKLQNGMPFASFYIYLKQVFLPALTLGMANQKNLRPDAFEQLLQDYESEKFNEGPSGVEIIRRMPAQDWFLAARNLLTPCPLVA